MDISKSEVAKRGYELVRKLEDFGCSPEWTEAVVLVNDYVVFAADEIEKATNAVNSAQQAKGAPPTPKDNTPKPCTCDIHELYKFNNEDYFKIDPNCPVHGFARLP